MKQDIVITDKQALKLADLLYGARFRVFAIGNFDVPKEDLARILSIAINSKNTKQAEEKLYNYYDGFMRLQERGY